jgi:hypothetical protein
MTNFEEPVNENAPQGEEFRIIQTAFNCHDNCPSQTAFRKVTADEALVFSESSRASEAKDGRIRAALGTFFEEFGKRHISRITDA